MSVGGKRVTSQDVANAAGVSRTTVSMVLNGVEGMKISPGTRQRVLDVAERLGYVPNAAARALVRQRAQVVGLILARSSRHLVSDVFITQILEGLLEVFRQHDISLLIDVVDPEHREDAYVQLARAKRIDGILFSGPRLDDEALPELEREGFPIVLIGQLPNSHLCMVDIDNRAAARKATAHLVECGRRKIACITNAQATYSAACERLEGYKLALQDAGQEYRTELVRFGDFTIDSGYRCMKDLLDSGEEFDAVFVASDTLALGARAALFERGLFVPQHVAMVGFDDLPTAQYMDPPLTSVHLPVSDLARQAGATLIALMNGDPVECRSIILDTHLVIRESCGGAEPAA